MHFDVAFLSRANERAAIVQCCVVGPNLIVIVSDSVRKGTHAQFLTR